MSDDLPRPRTVNMVPGVITMPVTRPEDRDRPQGPQGISRTFEPGAGIYHGPPMYLITQAEYEALRAVAEKARNVVAQWRGDISRKPHIGQLRDALRALDGDGG